MVLIRPGMQLVHLRGIEPLGWQVHAWLGEGGLGGSTGRR